MSWMIRSADKILDEPPNAAHLQSRRVVCRFSLQSPAEKADVDLAIQTPWLDFKASPPPADRDLCVALDALHLLREQIMEKEFDPEFRAAHLVSLPNYHIDVKLMVNGALSRPFSVETLNRVI